MNQNSNIFTDSSDESSIFKPFNFISIEKIKRTYSSPNFLPHNFKNKIFNNKETFNKETPTKAQSTSLETKTNSNCNSNNSEKFSPIIKFYEFNEILKNSKNKEKKIPEYFINNIYLSNYFFNNSKKTFSCSLSQNNNFSLLPPISAINKENMSNNERYYLKKLSENLMIFYEKVIQNNELIFSLKQKFYNTVYEILLKTLKPFNIVNIVVYGSQVTGLSLPESDIDLLIFYNESKNYTDIFLKELYNSFIKSKLFKKIIPLPRASTPLIKLEYNIDNNDLNINSLHMDISFCDLYPNKLIKNNPSIIIVNYIKSCLEYLPQSKAVIFFLKKYLKKLSLNNYYSGGLSSFSIFLLVFAFYKYLIKVFGQDRVFNFYIGQFLIYFLNFYSEFDFNKFIININKENPFIYRNSEDNSNDVIVILDPFTTNNIACGSFKISEIKKKFFELKENIENNYKKKIKISSTKIKHKNYYNNSYYYKKHRKKYYYSYYDNYSDYSNAELIDTNYDYSDEHKYEGEKYYEDDNNNDNYYYYYDGKNYNHEKYEDENNKENKKNYKNFEDYENSMDSVGNNASLNFIDELIF